MSLSASKLTCGFIALAMMVVSSCSRLETHRGFILISIDTLRADHLGLYGYDRETSPFLDSLGARGAVFENAVAQVPGTLPSHMSMFTGLYPTEHAVFPPSAVLSSEIATLPELFRAAGYRTGGFTEGGFVDGAFGFSRGFEVFDDQASRETSDIETTLAKGIEFLDSLDDTEQFFLFLHSYVVHDPYQPPAAYRPLFWQDPVPDAFEPTGPNLVAVNRGRLRLDEEGARYFEALYDAEIRYMNDALEDFFQGLDRLGLLDVSTVVLTSDHGEEFLEHGKVVHEQIYRETLHVPLVVLHPGVREGRRISQLVQTIDIAPSLLELAGIEPAVEFSGRSWVPLLHESEVHPGAVALSVAGNRRDRALWFQQHGAIYQFLDFQLQDERDGLWVSRQIDFETSAVELSLEATSYAKPRVIQVEVEGRALESWHLEPGRWTPINLDLEEPDLAKTVRLSTSECQSPREMGESSDPRCLSFKVRGIPSRRSQLFNLSLDPSGTNDLSKEQADLAIRLREQLEKMSPEVRSPSENRSIPKELEDRLRALGYLE